MAKHPRPRWWNPYPRDDRPWRTAVHWVPSLLLLLILVFVPWSRAQVYMPACVGIVALSQALLLWTHRRGSRLSRRYAAVLGVLAAGILGWTASRAIGAPLPGLGGSGVWTWAMVGISGLTILGHEALRPSAEHLDVDPDVFS